MSWHVSALEVSPQLSPEENQIKLAHLYFKPCCFSLQLKSPNYKEWGPVPRDCSVLSTRWHFWSSICKHYCMHTHTRLLPSKDSSCGGKVRVTQSQVVCMPSIYISCVISDVDKKILIPKALDERVCVTHSQVGVVLWSMELIRLLTLMLFDSLEFICVYVCEGEREKETESQGRKGELSCLEVQWLSRRPTY